LKCHFALADYFGGVGHLAVFYRMLCI
jgi:hypothetical protein